MDNCLSEKIFSDFPQLFIYNENEDMLPFVMFGFEVGSGWFPIIYEACKKLAIIQKDTGVTIQIRQVKEKFGGLRLYLSGPEEAFDIEDEAEEKSMTTCEACGDPGKQHNHGWITTLCEECAAGSKRLEDVDILKMIEEVNNGT